jgi:superfamily II DNA helicase RecQ
MEMAQKRPASVVEFERLSGVGKTKLKRYAAGFLKVISSFEH